MADVPDAWPPELGRTEGLVVPLFPLANVWLFPRMLLQLHVFEPRYRQMIEDSLDGPGRLVIGTVMPGHENELGGAPPVHPVAGLGEITQHERLPDGRFLISVWGRARARVHEAPSERLYRRVAVDLQLDSPVAATEASALRRELSRALRARSKEVVELPAEAPVDLLTDLLLLRLGLPHAALQDLYAEPDVARRARGSLEEHKRRPVAGD